MTIRRITFRAAWTAGLALLLCAFALAACGDDGEAGDGSEPEARGMRLIFDGETCTYEGGEELTAGLASLEFVNQSDVFGAMNLVRHTGDETIDDVVAYIGDEPSPKHAPAYTADVRGVWRPTAGGATYLWAGELEPAIHHMVCARLDPFGIWFGAGLTVTE